MVNIREELTKEEYLYKSLYQKRPAVWEKPVEGWEEMVHRYHRAGITDIPEQVPSLMEKVMTESLFFTEYEQDAVAFNNLRYCPPFLHTLEFTKLVYVRQGQIMLYLDEDRYMLQSGNLCIITPGIRHTVFSCHDEDIVINLLMRRSSFSEAFGGILMEQNILSDFFWKILYTRHSNRILVFRCENDEKLDLWIERLRRESRLGEKTSNLLMRSYVMIFLGFVMRDHLNQLQVVEELEDKVYAMPEIIQDIQNNMKYVTIGDLCVKFGMKKEELDSYILRESGYSFSYLLRDMRMRRAGMLLQNTHWSLEKIMEEVGYSNETAFGKAFKNYSGNSPAEFRQFRERIII